MTSALVPAPAGVVGTETRTKLGSGAPPATAFVPLMPVLKTWHGLVETTVTIWLHVLLLPQASVNSQVRVMTGWQGPPLVAVLVEVMVTLLPQHEEAVGRSNVQPLPNCTVLLVGQVTMVGAGQQVTSLIRTVVEPVVGSVTAMWMVLAPGDREMQMGIVTPQLVQAATEAPPLMV